MSLKSAERQAGEKDPEWPANNSGGSNLPCRGQEAPLCALPHMFAAKRRCVNPVWLARDAALASAHPGPDGAIRFMQAYGQSCP